jgi:hypothetical protein
MLGSSKPRALAALVVLAVLAVLAHRIYHTIAPSCQLRRLGARGGAGKPTLLSLKN